MVKFALYYPTVELDTYIYLPRHIDAKHAVQWLVNNWKDDTESLIVNDDFPLKMVLNLDGKVEELSIRTVFFKHYEDDDGL